MTADSRKLKQGLLLGVGMVGLLCGLWLMLVGSNPQAQAQAEPTQLPLYALPDARLTRTVNSGTIALASDNQTVLAVNSLNDTVSFAQPLLRRVVAEVPVGRDPRSVVLTADSERVLVTNRADGTLSIVRFDDQVIENTIRVGLLPYGVVTDNNEIAYVTLQGAGEVAVVDLLAGTVINRIATPPLPSGLALWGDFLYVTHFWSGQISLIYLPRQAVVQTIATGVDTGLSQSIEIDITRGLAYVPQTRSNSSSPALTYDTTVFPVVNVLDLRDLAVIRPARIGLDTADRPVNMPFATALDRFQQRLYVVNAGSNDLSVIDLINGRPLAHIALGANPRGALLNRDNSYLFVHNMIQGAITVINTATLSVESVLPISTPAVALDIIQGAQFFYGAHDARMSANDWISCANCHFDGLSDGRVWMSIDGGRNTPLLYDILGTPPYNWSATWDELADVELKIRDLQAGFGLIAGTVSPALGAPHAGQSPLLDTLAQYLVTLQGPALPPVDGALAGRGAEVFAEQGCGECHVGAVGTNLQAYDVGTGGTFDTPSLRWLALSAPYFHDGRAAALRDVFILPGAHQLVYAIALEDIEALLAYLLSLPQG
ncbi:MAG: hypothetical protein HXY40_17585 [Chloroflexi bacterium]|nr:hypothetical protein [Chloroflexota bacterium]